MTAIVWGDINDRKYEYGVDHGVLYPAGGAGVPWNGLISVEETIVGGESVPYHKDGVKYFDFIATEDFQANLTAISAPDEFNACDGIATIAAGLFATQQPRQTFGFSYRTRIGASTNSSLGYKLHLVYNAIAAPSGRVYSTLADAVDPGSRSWVIDSVPPVDLEGIKPTAHFVIDSTLADPDGLADLEEWIYGSVSEDAYLASPSTVVSLLTG